MVGQTRGKKGTEYTKSVHLGEIEGGTTNKKKKEEDNGDRKKRRK